MKLVVALIIGIFTFLVEFFLKIFWRETNWTLSLMGVYFHLTILQTTTWKEKLLMQTFLQIHDEVILLHYKGINLFQYKKALFYFLRDLTYSWYVFAFYLTPHKYITMPWYNLIARLFVQINKMCIHFKIVKFLM